jgi:two-component system nitrogen regulation sensor histidine kinase NtrY
MVHINALKDETNRYLGTMVVFDDLTELEKAQRMAAWREVARRIAHEVKNPLTPIKLSAQRLERKYGRRIKGDNGIFSECTKTIIEQVDQIRNLVNEFSTFARLPAVKLGPCSLPAIVKESVALYKEAHPYISFQVNVGKDIPEMTLDKGQLKRVLLNLIDNAIAAIDEDGGFIMIKLNFDPETNLARLEVSDNGIGISSEDKDRLFEPYFSTKKSGMGLGLSIVNAIIEDHHGTIRAEDNTPSGTRFVIELPV